jgi:MtN3 and saliva related transmembrane protein
MTDWVGYAAAILATFAFLPQVIKTVRTGQTKDISLGMYLLFCSGVALWLVYGFLTNAPPVIVANSATLLLSGIILVIKLKNG